MTALTTSPSPRTPPTCGSALTFTTAYWRCCLSLACGAVLVKQIRHLTVSTLSASSSFSPTTVRTTFPTNRASGSSTRRADQRETGFWRINDKDEIEFICCNSSGVVEIFYGNPLNERAWEVESASTMVTATGPAELGPGKRLYGLMPTNELGWVDERMVGKELRPRMSAQLARVVG